jgi:hypothetical protein
VAIVALAACAGGAVASVMVGSDPRDVRLRVGPAGAAEVAWTTAGGARRVAIVAPNGSIRWNERLPGRDVSQPVDIRLPYALAVQQAPDGSFYALQAWRRLRGGPIELRFSRWRGAPTRLTLTAVCCRWRSERIQGRATFQGKAIYGFAATRSGVPLDDLGRNVYLDTYRRGGWRRMMGILTHRPTGFFRLWIRPDWRGRRYRGTIIGPNWGWTLGPDARAWVESVLR